LDVKQSFKRGFQLFKDRLPLYNFRDVAKAVSIYSDSTGKRSHSRQDYVNLADKTIMQPYPYSILKTYFNRHPFLRIVGGAIIRQVLKVPIEPHPRFQKKCTVCNREYQFPVKVCKDCGDSGLLRGPNPQEKQVLAAFIRNPNRDDELVDIFTSTLKDNLSVDDWYLSVEPVPVPGPGTKQFVIYVEDASQMFICADEHSRLGNGEYFCKRCWRSELNEVTYKKGETCRDCGGPTMETAYIHKNAKGRVSARYSRDDIIHNNSDPWLPKLYGNSKVAAVLTELRSAIAMNSFNFDLYSSGEIGKIILLIGESQGTADQIGKSVKEQKQKIEVDTWTGRVGRRIHNLFLGTPSGGQVHDVMPDSKKMQSLDWMDWWFVKIVGGIYGVQPVMLNSSTKGPGGYFQKMQVTVGNDTIRECQTQLEIPLNEQLLPRMGIQDWILKFPEIEPLTELEHIQIWQARIAAGREAANSGLQAELTEDGELKVSGKFVKQESFFSSQQKPKDSPETPGPYQERPFAVTKLLNMVESIQKELKNN